MADETKQVTKGRRHTTTVEAGPEHRNGGGDDRKPCFVMMPISDPEGYAKGHFTRVYEDIFAPAIRQAGFRPVRADETVASNLIHLDILRRLREAPIAICDLSNRNGNVLYELGFRQAFDMPTVLVKEVGTPDLFDVAPLRAYSYRPARLYHEVLDDQAKIRDMILATVEEAEGQSGVNSLVRLLELERPATPAQVREAESDPALQLVRAELAEMRTEMRRLAIRSAAARESVDSGGRRPTSGPHALRNDFLITISKVPSELLDAAIRGIQNRAPFQSIVVLGSTTRITQLLLHTVSPMSILDARQSWAAASADYGIETMEVLSNDAPAAESSTNLLSRLRQGEFPVPPAG